MCSIYKGGNIMENELLWKQFLDGDNRAYAQLYKEYVNVLFLYGMGFTSNREIVKDCIQDVFIRIFNNRKNLKKTDNVKLYLFIALKNTLINYFERDKSSRNIGVDMVEPVFDMSFTIEDKIIAAESTKECSKATNLMLEVLTSRQREVIYYRYVEEMEIDAICKLMKMNYQSVLNLTQRSIKKIKEAYYEMKKEKSNRDEVNTIKLYIKKVK